MTFLIGSNQITITLEDFTTYVRALGFRQALRHEDAEVVVYQIQEGNHLILLPTTAPHPNAQTLVATAMCAIEDNDLGSEAHAEEFRDDMAYLRPVWRSLEAGSAALGWPITITPRWTVDRLALRIGSASEPDDIGLFPRGMCIDITHTERVTPTIRNPNGVITYEVDTAVPLSKVAREALDVLARHALDAAFSRVSDELAEAFRRNQ